jgi:hypothetical protein
MGKKLSTHFSDDNRGKAEVHVDFKHEMFYIKYFDNNNKRFYTEEFEGKTLRYVEDAAENWALGIKALEDFK